jgi:hypothetical protein
MGVLASGPPLSRALAPPPLSLPADLLEGCGPLFQTPWARTADGRRIPGGPGPCDEGAARMGLAGCGACSLVPMVSRGVCRGCEAEVAHQLCGLIDA